MKEEHMNMLNNFSDSNDSDSSAGSSNPEYNLRPRQMKRRLSQASVSNTSGQRGRSAPLSKYRRKTANARERFRMQEINDAFERLRNAVPNRPRDENDKHSKITTLRLAMNYINALKRLLDEDLQRSSSCSPPMMHSSMESNLSLDELYGDIQELIESDGNNYSDSSL